jgi:hypothetical protein
MKLLSFQEKTNSEKEIQESKESVIKIAKKYNINAKTVRSTKWILSNLTACFSVLLKKLHALDGPESEAHSIVKWRVIEIAFLI